jgi:hypothetical protein
MSLQSRPHPAEATSHDTSRSTWSVLTVAAAVLVWVGGILLHVLGALGPVVAVLGVLTAMVAIAREPRVRWFVAVALAGFACLMAAALYALVLTSTLDWPPARW